MKALILTLLLSVPPAFAGADIAQLTDQINSKTCPIYGLSGSIKEPDKLRIDFAPGATDEQKAAAVDYLKSVNLDAPELQPPDMNGFVLEAMQSLAISKDGLFALNLLMQVSDPAKKKQAIQDFINGRLVTEKSKIKELAAKYNIIDAK